MTQLLSLKEAARLLGLSIWTVRKFVRDGKLVPVRLSRRVLLEELELQRFIDQSRQKTQPNREQELMREG